MIKKVHREIKIELRTLFLNREHSFLKNPASTFWYQYKNEMLRREKLN